GPPLVYGPGVRGNFLSLLNAVYRRWPLPLGGIENRRSLLYVENLAAAIFCCVSHPAATGRTYLLSDGDDLSTAQLVRALASGLEVEPRLIGAAPGLRRILALLTGWQGLAEARTGSLQP